MSGGKVTDEQRAAIIAAIRDGAHPDIACTAFGLGAGYLRDLRYRARKGDTAAAEFADAIAAAVAHGELTDVQSTAKAARSEGTTVTCPHCSREYVADPAELALLVQAAESAQRVRKMQADVAITRLERRHPKRWSQRVNHVVQEEHERLLDVAQRVLTREVFELLLEEYLAEGNGEGEASGGQSGPATGDVH